MKKFENVKNQGQIHVHQILNYSDLVTTLENKRSYYDHESSHEALRLHGVIDIRMLLF